MMGRRPRIMVLDNRDSFSGNVLQALREVGAAAGMVDVFDHPGGLAPALRLDGLVISPGPGRPADVAGSTASLARWSPRIPTWGICLGHQCLAELHGARLVSATKILHGKTSRVFHSGTGLFAGLDPELEVMRYHSLLVDRASLPGSLDITAWTAEGEIMGLRCRETGAEGVQFHPESVIGASVRRMFLAFVLRSGARMALTAEERA
jgi:anthranilate synthase/aminodeoxychorismate synthase-like glutamine amidotransferase